MNIRTLTVVIRVRQINLFDRQHLSSSCIETNVHFRICTLFDKLASDPFESSR